MKDINENSTTDELVASARQSMSRNFRQAPIVFMRGQGVHLFDRNDKRYIDFVSGIAVMGMGHSHPRIVEAATEQARKLWHVSNLYFNEAQILLSNMLSDRYGDGRVFLCNSGAEAVESAIKLARRYAFVKHGDTKRNEFVSFEKSFHGRTLGALSATGQPKYHTGFQPIIPGFKYARFNDIESVKELVDSNTCAVIVEPIQAEGGLILPLPGFLSAVKEICEERGALLILDEVQVGSGRTGTFFAYEQEGVKPDIVTLAKALGAGIPIGAMIANQEASLGFQPGSHGSTFAGNALAARIAQVFLEVMEEENLLAHVQEVGAYMGNELNAMCERFDCLDSARGRGFIWGLGFNKEWAPETVALAMKKGLLVNKLNTRTIRLLPPLISERSHVDAALAILANCLTEISNNPPGDGNS